MNECRKSKENTANLDAPLDDQLGNAHCNGHTILCRWTNTRDTFARNYRRVVEMTKLKKLKKLKK